MEKANRLHYIDFLRGITMILVIYSHVNYKLFANYPESIINNIFITFRMPLFFFISGFFLYSDKIDINLLRKRLINRIIRQLYPTIIFLTIFLVLIGTDINTALTDPFKVGYWFTFVSVEMAVLILPLIFIMNYKKLQIKYRLIIFIPIMICSALICVGGRILGVESIVWTSLSLDPFFHYLPYLLLGCIFKMYYNQAITYMIKYRYFTIGLLLFCLTIAIPPLSLFNLIPAICGIYIIHFICYKIKERLVNNRIGLSVIKIGTSTLEIYLLHYIIIHFMTSLTTFINWGQFFCNTIWEFPLYVFISILIACSCIVVVWVLKQLRIYKFLFPEKAPNWLL